MTNREKQLLNFEEQWADQPIGQKQIAVQGELGIRHTQYVAAINKLIDREDAIAANPLLVYRLRARRERGIRERDARLVKEG